MDIVHHALIGGAGMLTTVEHAFPLIGVAFLAGSVFPDLDVFFMLLGKRFYLRNHQGITHSLLLSPLFGLLLSIPLWHMPGEETKLFLWLAAWAGICVHIWLDWFNTYRIELFGPLSKKRYSLDAVFFIDSVAIFCTVLFYIFHYWLHITVVEILYPMGFLGYFLLKLWLHHRVMRRLNPLFAIPSSLNPVEFYILEKHDQGLTGYLYNAMMGTIRSQQTYSEVADKYHKLAASSPVFNDMKHITRAFRIIEATEDQKGTTIVAADLAVRNFGGRFARTELQFDLQGRLIHEMANI